MKLPRLPFHLPPGLNPTIVMVGLNAIALVVLALVVVDQFSGTPATPEPIRAGMAGSPAAAAGFRLTKPLVEPLRGPISIAIQAGHWKNEDLPRELRHLIGVTGAEVQHVEEWVINKAVADALARRLAKAGYAVQVLPATVPAGLRADVFVAIHCDWADRSRNHGWKLSPPQKANKASRRLAAALEASFAAESSIRRDVAQISDNMYDYYAFNTAKYHHAIDPLTPAVIVELGFMSNPAEFKRLRQEPDWWASILERGIRDYLAKTPRNNPLLLAPAP